VHRGGLVGAAHGPLLGYRQVDGGTELPVGAAVDLSVPQERTVRRTDEPTAVHLRSAGGVDVLERSDGTLLALFNSPYWLNRVVADHPDWLLDPIVTT
jgi:peptide chain release factor 3